MSNLYQLGILLAVRQPAVALVLDEVCGPDDRPHSWLVLPVKWPDCSLLHTSHRNRVVDARVETGDKRADTSKNLGDREKRHLLRARRDFRAGGENALSVHAHGDSPILTIRTKHVLQLSTPSSIIITGIARLFRRAPTSIRPENFATVVQNDMQPSKMRST